MPDVKKPKPTAAELLISILDTAAPSDLAAVRQAIGKLNEQIEPLRLLEQALAMRVEARESRPKGPGRPPSPAPTLTDLQQEIRDLLRSEGPTVIARIAAELNRTNNAIGRAVNTCPLFEREKSVVRLTG